MRAALLAMVVAGAMIGAGSAGARGVEQGPPAESIDKVAGNLCNAEQKKLGESAFAAKYGSLEGCKQQKAAEAEQLLRSAAQACRGEGQQSGTPAFQQCVQGKVQEAIKSQGGAGGAGDEKVKPVAEQAAGIADTICKNLRQKLGEEKFAAKFGSHGACKQQQTAKATEIAQQANARCKDKSPSERKSCTQAAVQELVKAQAATATKPSIDASEVAKTVATNMCQNAREKLGAEKFDKKYGTLGKCKEAMAAKAAEIAKAVVANCNDAADRKACVQQEVKKAVAKK